MTKEEFIYFYETQKHDWNAAVRMNTNVNGALGVDLFDTTLFPIAACVEDQKVSLTHLPAHGSEIKLTLSYDDAAEYIKELVNAW